MISTEQLIKQLKKIDESMPWVYFAGLFSYLADQQTVEGSFFYQFSEQITAKLEIQEILEDYERTKKSPVQSPNK